jgi:hypothetical protein
MAATFSPEICADTTERNHRFLEEALELVQSLGCTASEAHQLVDYTYDRPQGDVNQEVGGVMVTLAALCLAAGNDMDAGGEAELARVWTKIDQIRAKQASKPKHSPLPEANLETNLCDDCPPFDYTTDATRCAPCPRRAHRMLGPSCMGALATNEPCRPDETLRRCTICGFIVDTKFKAEL